MTDCDDHADHQTGPEEIFRLAKRRKFYRKRTDVGDWDAAQDTLTPPIHSSPALEDSAVREDEADAQLPVSEVVRQQRLPQRRKGGIEFSSARPASQDEMYEHGQNSHEQEKKNVSLELENVDNRFARQTGQVVDVNKHMYVKSLIPLHGEAEAHGVRMAYIDSELAKRRQAQASMSANDGQDSTVTSMGLGPDLTVNREPASLGKLQEIDLGPDATARNIAATEAAKRRLAGEVSEHEEVPVKVRLRRDGKPWRPRKRRNSEDVRRDQLVEEVMRESKSMVETLILLDTETDRFQLSSTMNPIPRRLMRTMTRALTTVSLSSSGRSSWMPSHRDERSLSQRRQGRMRKMTRSRVRSWVEVGVRELRCESYKRKRRQARSERHSLALKHLVHNRMSKISRPCLDQPQDSYGLPSALLDDGVYNIPGQVPRSN